MEQKIKEYIQTLKIRVLSIKDNLPEYWAHEQLKEMQVLCRTIDELKTIINDTSTDEQLNNIKIWLRHGFGRRI